MKGRDEELNTVSHNVGPNSTGINLLQVLHSSPAKSVTSFSPAHVEAFRSQTRFDPQRQIYQQVIEKNDTPNTRPDKLPS